MPSQTPKQHRAMEAAAHGKSTLGIPAKVGKDFVRADANKPAALAKGGKLVDHGDHFKLHTAGGAVMTIAHKGLHPSTVKHLQKFAEGGTARKEAMDKAADSALSAPETPEERAASAKADPGERPSTREEQEQQAAGYSDDPEGMAKVTSKLSEINDPQPQMFPGVDMPGQEAAPPGHAVPMDDVNGSFIDKEAPNGGSLGANPAAPEATPPEAAGPTLQGYAAPVVHGQSAAEKEQTLAGNAARTEGAAKQAAIAGEVEKANNERIKGVQDAQALSDMHREQILKEQDQLRNDIQNGKIDPDHYWHEKGTGGRITASIGLLLSGLGAGLGHTQNLALKVIESNIDRDIAAQEKNLATKQSLLADTYRRTGDLRLATMEVKNTLTTVALAKANTLAAKSSAASVQTAAQVLNAATLVKQEQDARNIADRRSIAQVNAKNAGIHDQNALAMAQVKAQGKGEKTINDRTNFQIGAIRQAHNLMSEMEQGVPSPAKVAASHFIPGDRTVDHWEDMRNKLALEQGKISKQGTPDKEEVNRFLERGTKADSFTTEGAHKKYLSEQREWMNGQGAAIGDQFVQEGRKDPFGDIPGLAWKDRHNPDGSPKKKVAKPVGD